MEQEKNCMGNSKIKMRPDVLVISIFVIAMGVLLLIHALTAGGARAGSFPAKFYARSLENGIRSPVQY